MCGLSFCRGTLTRPRQFGSVEWLKDDAGDDGDDGMGIITREVGHSIVLV